MKKFLFIVFTTVMMLKGFAQRTPTHPFDFTDPSKSTSTNLTSAFDSWTPGTPLADYDEFEEEFYISRVRPLERFTDSETQIHSSLDPNRKMCLWVPCADPSKKWQALPRYSFEGDNFGLWSYVDIHGNWAAPWFRVSAGLLDAAHKNGVKVGCVAVLGWAESIAEGTPWGNLLAKLFVKDTDGSFPNAKKLVSLLKYYGIDRIGFNSEFASNSQTMSKLQDFLAQCYIEAEAIEWHFGVDWYNGMDDAGGTGSYYNFLKDDGYTTTINNFQKDGKKVSDMFFLNYKSDDSAMQKSEAMCQKYGRNSYDVYAGFQGDALKIEDGYPNTWKALQNHKISIGIWGGHEQSNLHQSANDLGSSDYVIQNTYAKKQELLFCGGNNNPAKLPLVEKGTDLGLESLKNFHGIASYVIARSTLQKLPFITRFSLGNGLKRYDKGVVTFDHKWYNLGGQDFLPTWRWWITDNNNVVSSNLIKAQMCFDDAWIGGNSVKFSGATVASRVRLFKTKFTVKPTDKLSLRYKVLNGIETHAKFFVSKKGEALIPIEVALPAGKVGEWTLFETNLSTLGIAEGDVISVLGVSFENTSDDYAFLLGEVQLVDPSQTFNPVQPTIRKVEILRGRYNAVDFKIFYKSKDETTVKTYNDEVDTWYFNIYTQQAGKSPVLVTSTPSWGAYVIDAVCSIDDLNTRYGVSAVAPDGTETAITWSNYIERPIVPVETVVIDKPVIKPNEEFTVKFLDPLHESVDWSVVDPSTGNTIATKTNSTELTTSIDKVGVYDLVVSKDDKKLTTRGFIQISPIETGCVPSISSLEATKTEGTVGEEIALTYTGNKGEGSVSRSLRISDPQKFKIDGTIQTGYPYSYALWFKASKFAHDKQGTNLINKVKLSDNWADNNWGDLWVAIRPQWQGVEFHPANEISFNIYVWHNRDNPNENMMSKGYSITPGVWNHLVVTASLDEQCMYLNGKLVARQTNYNNTSFNGYVNRVSRCHEGDVYIGGPNVYKAGFDGWIDDLQIWSKTLTADEVLQSMKGYNVAPDNLDGYFDFETVNDDMTFTNKGKKSSIKGELIVTSNTSGEVTKDYVDTRVSPNNSDLGCPLLPGTLPVTTITRWLLSGVSNVAPLENGKTISYDVEGVYTVGLTLSNMWGEDTLLKNEYLVIGSGDGVEDIEDHKVAFSVYPNPFVEEVNLFFEHEGAYKIVISTMEGMQLSTKKLHVKAQEVVSMQVNGRAGMYLVQVYSSSNKMVKAFKVIKK